MSNANEDTQLVAELIAAGVSADLVAKVAVLASQLSSLNKRRADDAKRQRQARAMRHVTSRESRDVPPTKERKVSPTPPLKKENYTPTDLCAVADATRTYESKKEVAEERFEEFWRVFPKRKGANPKATAHKSYIAALRKGAREEEIIRGAMACARSDADQAGTPYLPMAATWLNQERWNDYCRHDERPRKVITGWEPGMPTQEEIERRMQHERLGGILGNGKETQCETNGAGKRNAEGRDIPGDQSREHGMVQLGGVFPGSRL